MLNYKKAFLWSALFVSVCAGEVAVAQPDTQLPNVFSELNGVVPKRKALYKEGAIVRSRFMLINMGLFFDKNWKPKSMDRIPKVRLNLFPDINSTVTMVGLDFNTVGSSYSMWGKASPPCPECSGGDFSFSANAESLSGALNGVSTYVYDIVCLPQDKHYLCEITEYDVSKQPNVD